MDTGDRIRNARKKAGLTQSELGKKLGVPFQSISQWERGKRHPKFETMVNLAYALDVDIDYLLGTEDVESLKEDRAMQKEMMESMTEEDVDVLCKLFDMTEDEVIDAIGKDGSEDSAVRRTRVKLYTALKTYIPPVTIRWENAKVQQERGTEDAGRGLEYRLFLAFIRLNDAGKEKAVERVEELAEIPKYRESPIIGKG